MASPSHRQQALDAMHRCGCCGGSLRSPECDLWCARCETHIDNTATHLWDRTYEAKHGKPCPFKEK